MLARSSQDGNSRRKSHINTQGAILAALRPEESKCQSGNASCACDDLTTVADRLPEEYLRTKTEERPVLGNYSLVRPRGSQGGRYCVHMVHIKSAVGEKESELSRTVRGKRAKTIDSRE